MAYGQTGSGKTYSMGTAAKARDTSMIKQEMIKEEPGTSTMIDGDDGVIPRAVDLIFSRIHKLGKDYDFKVFILIRVYIENIYFQI